MLKSNYLTCLTFVPKVTVLRYSTKTYSRFLSHLYLIFVLSAHLVDFRSNFISDMTIAERIRLTRQKKKLSQAELAEASGVNKKSLSRYELGTSVPPADALKAIADALSVSADYLLSDDPVMIKDKDLLEKFEVVQEIDGDARHVINNFLDMAIRDHKARKAYAS